MSNRFSACVVIPVKDDVGGLSRCLETLVPALSENTRAIIVDDGSAEPLLEQPEISPYLNDERFVFLRHETNRGPGAARDTGIVWARNNGAELGIFLDVDCEVESDFISAHIELHRRYSDAACAGGSITGQGNGPWALIDGAMSWFTSMRESPEGLVASPYHIPTTNMSLKLCAFRDNQLFDHNLRTGEDVAFIQQMRDRGQAIIFSPQPSITHHDRESLRAMLRHQYRWGLHTYVVRRGTRRMDLWNRLSFAAVFLICSPLYVLLATGLNLRPLLRRSLGFLILTPAIMIVYAIKSVGVLEGTLNPRKALFGSVEPPH